MENCDGRENLKTRLWLFAIIALGFLLRAYVSAVGYYTTFDTGTVGLMALNILDGERPLFFYGQNYMGALEAYFAAFLFWIFGPSEFMLSMSPAIFSLGWIGATFLLFKELINARAGLAAALCVALPGWVIIWYSVGSYGGYPAAFFLGTLALWIVLRITGRELPAKSLWMHVLSLGLVAGLAIWTHYITATYLLTGAVLLAVYFARNRFSARVILPFAAGAVLLMICVLPVFIAYNDYECTKAGDWRISGAVMFHHLKGLLHRPLREHLFFPKTLPFLLKSFLMVILFSVAGLYMWRVKKAVDRKERYRLLLPVLFACVFLALYLPHSMASFNVSRYTIPLWMIMVSGMFAASVTASNTVLRRIAIGLLVLWAGYFAVSDIVIARSKKEDKERAMASRGQVIENAEKAGIKSVVLIGGEVFGLSGQYLSFESSGRIKIVSASHERHQPSAQAVESDDDRAFGCHVDDLPFLKTALEELGVSYGVIDGPRISLVHELSVKPVSRRLVPVGETRVELCGPAKGNAGDICDRITETFLSGPCDGKSGFAVDFGKERKINSMVLFAPDYTQSGLPRGYSISVSRDGTNFDVIRDVQCRLSPSYISGNQVFLKGYYGMLESRFDPVSARYVRVMFRTGQFRENEWRVSELLMFEETGTVAAPVSSEEVDSIVSVLRKNDVKFTAADRWLSAKLFKQFDGDGKTAHVYPCYDPIYKKTHISRIVEPVKGVAIAVALEYAEECERVIRDVYGENAAWDRIDTGHYSLLIFSGTANATADRTKLYWTGHVLLKTVGLRQEVIEVKLTQEEKGCLIP